MICGYVCPVGTCEWPVCVCVCVYDLCDLCVCVFVCVWPVWPLGLCDLCDLWVCMICVTSGYVWPVWPLGIYAPIWLMGTSVMEMCSPHTRMWQLHFPSHQRWRSVSWEHCTIGKLIKWPDKGEFYHHPGTHHIEVLWRWDNHPWKHSKYTEIEDGISSTVFSIKQMLAGWIMW